MPVKEDILLLRGVAQNIERFPSIESVVFSASMWKRQGITSMCMGHAMLHPILPGDEWPSTMFKPGLTMPAELSHVHVYSLYRNKGIGTDLVSAIVSYSKRKNWRIVLRVTPYGRGDRLTEEQLISWYMKFGFNICDRIEKVVYMASS